MRYYPAAIALSLLVAVTASVGQAGDYAADPRAASLVSQGRSLKHAGKTAEAIDAFEAALAVDPGYSAIYLDLAEAARLEGLQGKAIHYYRAALEREPDNLRRDLGRGRGPGREGRGREGQAQPRQARDDVRRELRGNPGARDGDRERPAAEDPYRGSGAPDPVVTQN